METAFLGDIEAVKTLLDHGWMLISEVNMGNGTDICKWQELF